MEIERKFILNELFDFNLLRGCKEYVIEQYYISLSPEIRIRCKRDKSNNVEQCFLTLKSEGGLVRQEIEEKVSIDVFETFKKCAIGIVLSKSRFEIILDDHHIAEIDIYKKDYEGLKIAEIEFAFLEDGKNFDSKLPIWFGREVTEIKNFKNKSLAIGNPKDILM